MSIKTVTVRELRTSFPKIEAMLLGGQQIAITKRGRVIALLVEPSKVNARASSIGKNDLALQ